MANPGVDPNILQIGQSLNIPTNNASSISTNSVSTNAVTDNTDYSTQYPNYTIDPAEIRRRMAWAESVYKKDALSDAGAKGIFQITPTVYDEYVKRTNNQGDLFDPNFNAQVRD